MGEATADEGRGAMTERAATPAAAGRRPRGKGADQEAAVLEKIAGLPEPDRGMAERLHALVRRGAPGLAPRLWYGMPAYSRDGKVVCFFQPASRFGARYATLGFNDAARLDDGAMWPTAFALAELTAEVERAIEALVARAVG